MTRKSPLPILLLVYGGAALCLTWPVALDPMGVVAGAERSDLWNSLWSLWYFQDSVFGGSSPLSTQLLGFPSGGSLAVADPLNAVLGLALVPLLGLTASYNLLVVGHLVFSGCAAHRLTEALQPEGEHGVAAWVGGVSFAAAPVLISAVHNGTSEAIAGGWLALALLMGLRALRRPGWRRTIVASLALAAALWSSWYLGVCALLGLAALATLGEGRGGSKRRLVVLVPVLILGSLAALPLAWVQHEASTAAGNLVGIKSAVELSLVRRMTGAADPLGFFVPGDFRSPDFRVLSRYGEDFIHCTYVGWIVMLGSVLAVVRRNARAGTGWLWLAAVAGLVLALGPVLVHDGQALLLPGDRVVPLPYLALEALPGFSGLSLLFRFAMLPALALAVLAARGFSGLGKRPGLVAVFVALAVFAELRLVAPVSGLPDTSDTSLSAPLQALAQAGPGAVMNFPVAGGRGYLYEQTLHGKPITGGLNFPNNAASMRVWDAIIDTEQRDEQAYVQEVQRAACREGIGYLVVHIDPMARPDRHDAGVRALHRRMPVLDSSPALRVHVLCPPGEGTSPSSRGSGSQSG